MSGFYVLSSEWQACDSAIVKRWPKTNHTLNMAITTSVVYHATPVHKPTNSVVIQGHYNHNDEYLPSSSAGGTLAFLVLGCCYGLSFRNI